MHCCPIHCVCTVLFKSDHHPCIAVGVTPEILQIVHCTISTVLIESLYPDFQEIGGGLTKRLHNLICLQSLSRIKALCVGALYVCSGSVWIKVLSQ